MLEGVYKKLKSYYYYDKTLVHIKRKIIDYESTREIALEMQKLAKKIVSKDLTYFDELIECVSYVVFPKSFKGADNNGIICGKVDNHKKINKINFAIDLPIELYMIDFLWTLLVCKIVKDKKLISQCSYASKMKRGIIRSGNELTDSIDFESNRSFEPYFQCYTRWRNGALDAVQNASVKNDVLLISLDLKSFYYNVDFDFSELEIVLLDNRYSEFSFITDIIKKIYHKYTLCITGVKKGISKKKDKYVFPIGLVSPFVLRDIVMRKIDDSICEVLKPQYYGRYVDDMLLVIDKHCDEDNRVAHVLKELFIDNGILQKNTEKNEYFFMKNKSLKVQYEKVNCIYFEKGADNVMLDIYFSNIKRNASEANMLPDIDLLNESFRTEAYKLKATDSTGKIRNIEFMESDNYNATLFINGLKQLLMNASFEKASIDLYLDDILSFYDGSQAIEFSNTWRSIFELLVLCKDKKRANDFYIKVKRIIKDLTFDCLDGDELYVKTKKKVLKQLKDTLIDKLDMSISLAIALDYRRGKIRYHIDLAKKIRIANMMNHSMVTIPLLNYALNEYTLEQPLIDFDYTRLFSNISEKTSSLTLSKTMLKWSPRFIHLHELYLSNFYFRVGFANTFAHDEHDEIFRRYININHLSSKIEKPLECKTIDDVSLPSVCTKTIHIINADKEASRLIGLVNTKIDELDVLSNLTSSSKGVSLKKKRKLFKLLNEAKEQKVSYLLFPEFYMPVLWLKDVCRFAKNAKISITTGLQYITCNGQAFNVVCNLQNSYSTIGFKNMIPLFREKNNYAPDEMVELAQQRYYSRNPSKSIYYLVNDGKIQYSTILCYEFTDIASRYLLKGKTDFICVPQLNRDTNYFSSIVESASRDLHTIIVQANTSKYGDSRITGPFKTDYKDVLKIKGGKNDILIVGEIKWKELQDFRKNYYQRLYRSIQSCYLCDRKNRKCDNCKQNFLKTKKHIKGLPPNWNEE